MSDALADGPLAPHIDLAQLLDDIDAEVRRRRASGELTPDFERNLDVAFARYAPVDAVRGDFPTLLAKLEQSVTFDTRAPTLSARPGVPQIKALVAKAIDWDIRHLATQVSGVAHAVTRALGQLGERVDALEAESPGTREDLVLSLVDGPTRSALPDGPWAETATAVLAGVERRVAHVECGDGALVAHLQAAGLDAYGVDPDDYTIAAASARVTDLRTGPAVDHLRRLPAGTLGGVILSGFVDRQPAGAVVAAVRAARAALVPGGRLLVISHDPDRWAATQPVLADLAGGRPWSPVTWTAVLGHLGFAIDQGPTGPTGPSDAQGYAVAATR